MIKNRIKGALLKNSILNYIAYFTHTYIFFIIIKSFNVNENEIGIFLAIIFSATLLLPFVKKIHRKLNSKINLLFASSVIYLLTLLLMLVCVVYKSFFLLFSISAFINILSYSVQMAEFKMILLRNEENNRQIELIEKYSQIVIELGYGIGMIFGGFIISYLNNVYLLIILDIILSAIFILFNYMILKNYSFNELDIKNEETIKAESSLFNKKFIPYLFIAITGYILFRQDDSVIAYSYEALKNGAFIFGVAITISSFSGIIFTILLDIIVRKVGTRVIYSIIIMFLSLIIIVNLQSLNILYFILAAILNGAGVTAFLSNIKAYLVIKNKEKIDEIVIFCSFTKDIMSVVVPLVFLNLLVFKGEIIYIFVLCLFVIISISMIILKRGEKEE